VKQHGDHRIEIFSDSQSRQIKHLAIGRTFGEGQLGRQYGPVAVKVTIAFKYILK
jgi:hypothetical protein